MAIIITAPPKNLIFASLADLYRQFNELLINREFRCPRGISINITRHHFFHLVKLQKGIQTEFKIEVEEPLIRATKQGLGNYAIDVSRAQRLSWIPDILGEPHEIWEPYEKKTADEMILREYKKAGSAFRAVLLKREQDYLTLITCMPVHRREVRKLRGRGKKLWP